MGSDGRQERVDRALAEEVARRNGEDITGQSLSDVAQAVSITVGFPVVVVPASHAMDGVLAYPMPWPVRQSDGPMSG